MFVIKVLCGLQQSASCSRKCSEEQVVQYDPCSDECGSDKASATNVPGHEDNVPLSREIGTQCCVGARYVITKTVSTQIEPIEIVSVRVHVDGTDGGVKQTMFDKCYSSDVDLPHSDLLSSPISPCSDENEYELSDSSDPSTLDSTNFGSVYSLKINRNV